MVRTPLANALNNPVPVFMPTNGVRISPIPAGGAFEVPVDAVIGRG